MWLRKRWPNKTALSMVIFDRQNHIYKNVTKCKYSFHSTTALGPIKPFYSTRVMAQNGKRVEAPQNTAGHLTNQTVVVVVVVVVLRPYSFCLICLSQKAVWLMNWWCGIDLAIRFNNFNKALDINVNCYLKINITYAKMRHVSDMKVPKHVKGLKMF